MKTTDRIDETMVCANLLISFIAKTEFLPKDEVEILAGYIKLREPEGMSNAEKHFLIATRAYLLDYLAETGE